MDLINGIGAASVVPLGHCEACGIDTPLDRLHEMRPEPDVTQYLCIDTEACMARVDGQLNVSGRLVTRESLAAAFTEWDRRYREDPDGFNAEWIRLHNEEGGAETYGLLAAAYLLKLLTFQPAVPR
jgi:thymidylate kinase